MIACQRFHVLRWLVAAVCVLVSAAASARTIELTDLDCEQMAAIGPQAPRSSWVAYESGVGEFSTIYFDLVAERSFLIRYPLDRIPAGQRITRAEWVLPVVLTSPAGERRLNVRRIVGAWGPGVCHQFRTQRPKPIPWALPGAAGISTDRANQPSAVVRISGAGEQVVNVTEDVELWYTGAVENHGWILSVDDPTGLIRLYSPCYSGRGMYKLRITYEPE